MVSAAVRASQKPQTLMALERRRSEILEIDLFDHCTKSHQFDAWQSEGSHQKQETLFRRFVLTFARRLEAVQFLGVATLLNIIIIAV